MLTINTYRPFPGAKWKVVLSCSYWSWGVCTGYHYYYLGPRSSWLRSGFTHECYVKRFTVTPCSEKWVTMHNVSLRIWKNLAPVFFTLRRLNSPSITIEKGETTHVKTLKWEQYGCFWSLSISGRRETGLVAAAGVWRGERPQHQPPRLCEYPAQGSFRSGKTGKVREIQKRFSSH